MTQKTHKTIARTITIIGVKEQDPPVSAEEIVKRAEYYASIAFDENPESLIDISEL